MTWSGAARIIRGTRLSKFGTNLAFQGFLGDTILKVRRALENLEWLVTLCTRQKINGEYRRNLTLVGSKIFCFSRIC